MAHPHHVTGTLADATAAARARVAAAAAARAADATPSRVAPRVYVGGAASARDAAALAAAAITHVVNAAPSLPNWHDASKGAARPLTYMNVPVFDDARDDLGAFFPSVVAFIDAALAAGGAVLIHCVAGASRSVTLAAAWLVASRGASAAAALAAVRAARPRAAPNAGFLAQLAAWAATGAVAPPPPPAVLLAVTKPARAASAAVLAMPPRPRSAPLPGSKSAAALAGLPSSDRVAVQEDAADGDGGGTSDA